MTGTSSKKLAGVLGAVLLLSVTFGLAGTATAEAPQAESLAPLIERLGNKIFGSDVGVHDCFGRSVAIDGELMIVGAKGDDDGGSDSGAAYAFRLVDGEWVELGKVRSSDSQMKDFFGYAVAIDGEQMAIGAWAADAGANGTGAAYVFELRDGAWVETQKIISKDAAAFDAFGYSVALKNGTLVVGAREKDLLEGEDVRSAGAAYIFEEKNGRFVETARLVASDPALNAEFGTAVATNGDVAVIGAIQDGRQVIESGAAYVFERRDGDWVQTSKLGEEIAAANDNFGWAVGISGQTIAIGAYGDVVDGTNSGAAYIYEARDGEWKQAARLAPPAAKGDELFGWSIDIEDETVVVGAWQDSDNAKTMGSAYVFKRQGDSWSQDSKLVSASPRDMDLFGWAVAVSGDQVAVGARFDDQVADEGGAIYLH